MDDAGHGRIESNKIMAKLLDLRSFGISCLVCGIGWRGKECTLLRIVQREMCASCTVLGYDGVQSKPVWIINYVCRCIAGIAKGDPRWLTAFEVAA